MHRSWFPAILLGLSLLLAVVFLTVAQGGMPRSVFAPREEVETVEPVTEEGYKTALQATLSQYKEEQDAEATYNSLILLRVPTAFQTLHFDLVVAMGKLMVGQREEGQARIEAIKVQNPWLSL